MSKPHAGGFNGLKPCGAKSKRTGKPCRQPAMANGRCRLHGGIVGSNHGRPATTGQWTKEAIRQRREVRQLIRLMKDTMSDLE